MTRRTVIFSGRVQGVGFRATVVGCVGDAAVTGYVRNLEDGRVEAVFEGPREAIDAVLDRVRDRMRWAIGSESAIESATTGEFDDFRIRR